MSGFIDRGNNRHTYFLGINGDGNLYERSSEPKEGFVPHVNPMTKQQSGYWKEYPGGFCAYLNHIGVKTATNKAGVSMDYFMMMFRDYSSENDFLVMIPMRTQKGGLHRYVKSFVKYYRNIDLTRELIFNAFKRKKDDNYAPSNLLFAYELPDGKSEMVPLYFKKGLNGWVEAERQTTYDGREVTNTEKQDAFVYTKLQEYIEDFKNRIQGVRKAILEDRMNKGLPLYGHVPVGSQGTVQQPAAEQPPMEEAPHFPPPEPIQEARQKAAVPPPPPSPAPSMPSYDDDLPF